MYLFIINFFGGAGEPMKAKEKLNITALIFFAALVLKYIIFGFRYYPILDDFIQYGGYPLYNDLKYVYLGIGTISARPLASLLDPVLWGSMWGNMWLALVLITAIHFAAVCLLSKTLERLGYKASPLFYIILLFLPIGSEGAYWISASSRTVMGLFFASLSFYFLVRALSGREKYLYVLFVAAHLLSYGFYESAAVLSAVGVYLIMLKNKEQIKTKWWILLIPVLCMLALLSYNLLAADIGAIGSRASGFSFSGLFGKIKDAIYQLGRIFTKGLYNSTVLGFFDGAKVVAKKGILGGIWIILASILSALLAKITVKDEETKPKWELFLYGLVLFAAPLAPNLLVSMVWLPYRTVFISFLGLALMAEPLYKFVFRKKMFGGIACGLVLFVFLFAGVNEYDTYKRVSEYDTRVAQNISEQLDDEVMSGKKNAVVILERGTDIYQVDFYKDHVKSVLEADWSMTGAVRATTKNMKIKKITPVLSGQEEITNEQVLFMGADGHITDITDEYREN
jgi:hypothetical protein